MFPPAKEVVKAAAPAAADAVNPLLVDAAIVVALPVVVLGVSAFVSAISGEAPKTKEVSSPATSGWSAPASSAGSEASGDSKGRSAPEIFFGGLTNLGKEPFGWLSGGPSALTSTLPTEPAPNTAGGRGMGAKELAKR